MPPDDDFVADDPGSTDMVPRSHIRDLEAKASRTAELEAKLATVERENAFSRVLGTVVTDPKAKWFLKAYDGEMSDDAIRSAATEAGFLSTEPPASSAPQGGLANPDELAAQARMAQASAGAPGQRQVDPVEELGQLGEKSVQEILDLVEARGYRTNRNNQ